MPHLRHPGHREEILNKWTIHIELIPVKPRLCIMQFSSITKLVYSQCKIKYKQSQTQTSSWIHVISFMFNLNLREAQVHWKNEIVAVNLISKPRVTWQISLEEWQRFGRSQQKNDFCHSTQTNFQLQTFSRLNVCQEHTLFENSVPNVIAHNSCFNYMNVPPCRTRNQALRSSETKAIIRHNSHTKTELYKIQHIHYMAKQDNHAIKTASYGHHHLDNCCLRTTAAYNAHV